ncbi:adenylyltransferase and sulfurtransferase mocs3-like protein [Vairimorpha apis BRL 01]|uniref:Adenylyltransferase and sulfurtransferase mocs3-like protein n=1 Tax=Vairimorpha apis BRL 01 TaxID=1037528 RepID=T0L1H0_9MICR|nr:adenylyltransferase and sulfurtransferase mocs3-like protein [Vairimorpha apis BRL 01]
MKYESDLFYHEVERYSRQIIVPEINIENQIKLRNSKILIVGCGGLGIPLIMYMSTCGISVIGIVDFDKIEIHNLQRQVIYKENDIGNFKVDVAYNYLKSLNSTIIINKYNVKIDISNAETIIKEYNIIIDCTDSIETRYILSDISKLHNKDFVCASVIRWEGHLYVFKKNGPCYRCLYPEIKKIVTSCDENGIIGPICGFFGSLLGLEIIKCIIDINETKLIRFNGLNNSFNTFKLRNKQPYCVTCNKNLILKDNYLKLNCNSNIKIENIKEITWDEALKKNYTIIDIRKNINFRMLRVKDSINIPLSELKDNILKIKKFNNVALVCKSGISSLQGCMILQNKQINSVSIKGGINEFIYQYIKK